MVSSKMLKLILAPVLIVGCMLAFSQVMSKLNDGGSGHYAADGLAENIKAQNVAYENQAGKGGSMFSYGTEFDGSIGGLVKMAPIFVATTLYRPFIWESKKLTTLLSSLEGMALLFFTVSVIFKAGIKTTFQTLTKNPLAMYCFLFAIIFAMFVGATTLNFGTLCRYKIPCMPFYIMAIFLIQDTALKKKENLLKNKQVAEL